MNLQVVDGMLLQLPRSTTTSPGMHVTTPQHSAPQPTQLVVMQGIGGGAAAAASIPLAASS